MTNTVMHTDDAFEPVMSSYYHS